MKTFIQLNDGIAFAVINTGGELDHTVTPDHVTAIEYEGDDPDGLLGKKYNAANKTWEQPEVYVYAILDDKGRAMEIRRTVHPQEAEGKPLWEQDTPPNFYWANDKWNNPADDEVIDVEEVEPVLAIEENEEERLKRVAIARYTILKQKEEQERLYQEMIANGIDPIALATGDPV